MKSFSRCDTDNRVARRPEFDLEPGKVLKLFIPVFYLFWLNPGHPGLRHSLVGQMRALAKLGVDGVHFQDFFARPLDFNPTVGRTPDRASWEGGLDCLRDILQTCRAIQPGFTLSTDALWDRPLSLSQVGSSEGRDLSALHTAFPFWQPTCTLADEDSFSAVNKALRNRARLRIAPSDGQPLGGKATAGITNYLRAVLAARKLLGRTLLEGEIMATNTGHMHDRSVCQSCADGIAYVGPGWRVSGPSKWRPRRESQQRGTPPSCSSAMPHVRRESSGVHDEGHREGGPA